MLFRSEGTIVSVGPGRLDKAGNRIPMEISVGDHVLFGRYAGIEIKVNDVDHLFMKEDDILGILRK